MQIKCKRKVTEPAKFPEDENCLVVGLCVTNYGYLYHKSGKR